MWAAWEHNPMLSVHGGDEGVAWSYLFSLGVSWAVVVGAPAIVLFSGGSLIGVAILRWKKKKGGA